MNRPIGPTAIDDFVSASMITGLDRPRRLGDIVKLKNSLRRQGIIVPVAVTRDLDLILGLRRVAAIRLLGVDTDMIPVRFVDNLDDALTLMQHETDECRLPLLPSEAAALGMRLETLYRRPGQTLYVIAEAVGLSRSNYSRAKTLVQAATFAEDPIALTAVSMMDHSGKITPAYNMYAGRETAPSGKSRFDPEPNPEPEPEPKPEPEPEVRHSRRVTSPAQLTADWVPEPSDRSAYAVTQRRNLITRWGAEEGLSSVQIGDRIKILPQTVRRIARDLGVKITADEALGRGNIGRRIDSNRVMRETINDLSNVGMTLDLVRFDDLDTRELREWVLSLGDSLRIMTRFHKRLKELMNK